MIKEFVVEKVISMPLTLQERILYVSLENEVVGHLCPCGCGNKVLIRIGKAGWDYTEDKGKVTLYQSLGNWELPCHSHYWIRKNKIKWAGKWTDEEIEEGRQSDIEKKRQYFEDLNRHRKKIDILTSYAIKIKKFYRRYRH